MHDLQVLSVCSGTKGKVNVTFDNGVSLLLYGSEIRKLPSEEARLLMQEGAVISYECYQRILTETVGLRAKKRAVFLLERMDRTEHQLSEKLRSSGYPEVCVRDAVAYVKGYHYIDDLRYARHYIGYHQCCKSRQKLKLDLMRKGVSRNDIEQALEEAFDSDERIQIRKLLEKRQYNFADSDEKEQRRTYQFLMRRGYQSSDILCVMKNQD